MKERVLFVCTNNACRSQIAEGIVNHFLADRIEAFSAGTRPTSVHPRAIQVMKEIGIDISSQHSKSMEEFADQHFDYVITLCGGANEECPLFFGGVRKMHMGFDDPAGSEGTEEEIVAAFRRIRDDMKEKFMNFFQTKTGDEGNHGGN